jgi:hypothetical protein
MDTDECGTANIFAFLRIRAHLCLSVVSLSLIWIIPGDGGVRKSNGDPIERYFRGGGLGSIHTREHSTPETQPVEEVRGKQKR